MSGPDGEENLYRVASRGRVLCLDPSPAKRAALVSLAEDAGNIAVQAATLPETLDGLAAILVSEESELDLSVLRLQIARASGPLIPLIADTGAAAWLYTERHRCIDLTACGGNAELLARAN